MRSESGSVRALLAGQWLWLPEGQAVHIPQAEQDLRLEARCLRCCSQQHAAGSTASDQWHGGRRGKCIDQNECSI